MSGPINYHKAYMNVPWYRFPQVIVASFRLLASHGISARVQSQSCEVWSILTHFFESCFGANLQYNDLWRFHMGAHKTTTTHLQHTLTSNQSRLLEIEIQFFGPPDLRGRNRKTVHPALEGTYVPKDKPPPRRLVISDENLLGKAWSNDPDGPLFPFYPEPLARLEYFPHRFKGRLVSSQSGDLYDVMLCAIHPRKCKGLGCQLGRF